MRNRIRNRGEKERWDMYTRLDCKTNPPASKVQGLEMLFISASRAAISIEGEHTNCLHDTTEKAHHDRDGK